MSSCRSSRSTDDRLERILSVTDAALAHLDTEDMLGELLDRTRELLSVDTAAVLVLDEASGTLIARAAKGIEEEVRQGVRIPIGKGFAGRIAAEKRAVILDRVDHTTVLNPILRERGIHALMGVPMVSAGEVIGVVHVGTLRPRRFDDGDRELLQLVADRIALAIQMGTSHAQQTAAMALQTSLLPGRLPRVHGLTLAARYVPGEAGGVGGDWYDVFELGSGRLCVVVGDVVGRGLPAAIVMGRLRSTLRAFAMTNEEPSEILSMVDRKLEHFEPGEMATVLVARFDLALSRMDIASAGHPPPVLVHPGEPAEYVPVVADPPVGVGYRRLRHQLTVEMPEEKLLCFYTDGLIERRDAHLDRRLEQLRDVVTYDEPEQLCMSVMHAMVGQATPSDDIALLVLRHAPLPTDRIFSIELPAVPISLRRIRSELRRWLAGNGLHGQDEQDLVLAVGEATSNAVEHAYGGTRGTVSVEAELEDDVAVIVVRDHGHWRDPRGENRGRGSSIMSIITDDVRVERTPSGTTVAMRRRVNK